jgi:putative serine protease PepD
MTEKQPHQPQNEPGQQQGQPGSPYGTGPYGGTGDMPSYGSTPYDGTNPAPAQGPVQGYGTYQGTHGRDSQHAQQVGTPSGFGQSGAFQGTHPGGPWPHSGQTGATRTDQPKRRRGLALVATTALLVGTAGGVGGAAAYSALSDHAPATTPSVTAPLSNTAPIVAPDGSIQKAAAAVLPSVVKIGVLTQQGAASGSGIVISADGLIVTNNHVVEAGGQGGRLTVTLNDGRTVAATIVGRDELTDLAVIRADAKGLTPAKLGSSGALQVGQQVVAIGSPFGLEATVTSGIVSALNRPVTSGDGQSDSTTVFPAVQTDAAINPGNSGGALIDLAGRVVGINSAIKTAGDTGQSQGGNIGLGFAIPIDQAKPIIDELVAKGTASHARLGVKVGDAESSDGLQQGAQLGEVTPGGAADKAGLKSGDVVTAIDSHAIASGDALVAAVRSHRPGDEVKITYHRGSQTATVTVKLASDNGNPTG